MSSSDVQANQSAKKKTHTGADVWARETTLLHNFLLFYPSLRGVKDPEGAPEKGPPAEYSTPEASSLDVGQR